MSLALSILASGSAGNCSVLRCGGGAMLIDCGIGPRTTAARMKTLGIALADVQAICLTHLDYDHFNAAWMRQIVERKISVFCHRSRVDELARRVDDPAFARQICPFDGRPFSPLKGMRASSIRLPHDDLGSHGFVLEGFGGRIGYASDLGRVGEELLEAFGGLDVLALESNYEEQMQRQSPRPWFLKRRIMGGAGHLSNAEALAAVRKILDGAQRQGWPLPGHIVLLHRSRQCNCPVLLREMFSRDRRIAPRLVLAEQDRCSPWLTAGENKVPPGRQLELQWA